MPAHPVRMLVLRLAMRQAGITALIAAAWILAAGTDAGLAALLGGLIAILPNLYFAAKVFTRRAEAGHTPEQIVWGFYTGEAVKFIITAALFVVAAQMLADQFLPVVTTYIAVLSLHWLALLDNLRRSSVERYECESRRGCGRKWRRRH